ncbi:MAG TPA: D-Ala-D-Ala carboxypeptidase family metallohydrolase [Paludibacter sp.]|nr:D-Ala-D-Ala carboxypeptidase family metallohydrolase [Paludibacter sp.]HPM10306.1 D-Ala-D-Ala carboxypeptidase family metallohydrolase [Paludibacter sp.]
MKTPISKHFNYDEFEFSNKANELGIDNHIPSDKIRFAIRLLVLNILEPLRNIVQRPIILNSGYRCPELNKEIGGQKNSGTIK